MSFLKILTKRFTLSMNSPVTITPSSLDDVDSDELMPEIQELIEESRQHLLVSEDDIVEIRNTVDEARKIYNENKRLNTIIEQVSDLTYAMAWQKDIDGLYQYANKIHCVRFFGLPESCHDFVLGRSDVDLINEYRERTGKRHTFGELCISTDQHCMEQGKRCQYIEMGWQGDRLMILNVRKSPRFDTSGACVGTAGVAMEDVNNCREILNTMPDRIKRGQVEELDRGVWWIKESPCVFGDVEEGYVPSFLQDSDAVEKWIKGNHIK